MYNKTQKSSNRHFLDDLILKWIFLFPNEVHFYVNNCELKSSHILESGDVSPLQPPQCQWQILWHIDVAANVNSYFSTFQILATAQHFVTGEAGRECKGINHRLRGKGSINSQEPIDNIYNT